ncbi:MAG: carbohydrate kinase family protein [Brevinema sp.]
MRIAFIGGCDVDQFYTLQNGYPAMGGKAFVHDSGIRAGGMVANACMIAAGIGITTEMFHELSAKDPSTEIILQEFKSAGVGTTGITLGDRSNKRCLIFSLDGERAIFVLKYPKEDKIRLSPLQRDNILQADCIYTTISDIQLFVEAEELCREWYQEGKEVFIDCDANILKEELPCLKYATIVSMNSFGLEQIEKMNFSAKSFRDEYQIPMLIVTKGADGSELYTEQGVFFQKAIPAPIVDTTGAGDTFNISFLYAFHQRFEIEKCLFFAASAAGQAISQEGGRVKIDLTKIPL